MWIDRAHAVVSRIEPIIRHRRGIFFRIALLLALLIPAGLVFAWGNYYLAGTQPSSPPAQSSESTGGGGGHKKKKH